MTEFAELATAGRVATRATRTGTRCASLEPGRRPAPGRGRLGRERRRRSQTVAFAAANGLRVSGQGTGHGAAGLAPLEGTILIKTEGMRGIEIDAAARPRGSRPESSRSSSANARAPTASAGLPGSSPDVGVVGYTLGGGMSWLVAQDGFACNRVRAIELVTAAGEQRTVAAEKA